MSGFAAILILAIVMLVASAAISKATVDTECANQNLRAVLGSAKLPDCRAYEMVTPPYKEGYALLPASFAADGDRLIAYTLGDLASAPGSGEGVPRANFYSMERTSGSWQATSLNAPLTSYIGQLILASEATHDLTLWAQHTPKQPAVNRDLYIRMADGAYEFIGPLNPTTGNDEESDVIETTARGTDYPVATTEDFEHIVLAASQENYWASFDETAGAAGSLYEYSGAGREHPLLVGVSGAQKGNTQLIGLCGTELGGGTLGSAYNALSQNGETVYFTVLPKGRLGCGAARAPEFAELYSRSHGSLTSPLQPLTTDISESECNQSCGSESGKNFEGASEDGSKVYFTSTQKLTDSAVDGTEGGIRDASAEEGCSVITSGPGCNLYLYDFSLPEHERLTLVATEVLGVAGVAEDGSHVYFVGRAAAGIGANPYGREAQAGAHNLFVYDTQSKRTSLVATLGNEVEDWQKEFFRPVEVAADGRYLLFASSAPEITASDDASTLVQLFEYSAAAGAEPAELVRITKGEDGFNANGNGVAMGVVPESVSLRTVRQGRSQDFHTAADETNMSVDGKTVVFQTAGQLSPYARSASSHCTSVYEFHSDGRLSEGEVHLLSDGLDVQPNRGSACGTEFLAMDADGENIFIATADPLLASDTDGVQRDIYDVRADGGFAPVPMSGELGSCEAYSCDGQASNNVFMPVAPSSLTEKAELGPVTENGGSADRKPQKVAKLHKANRTSVKTGCRRNIRKRKSTCKRKAQQRRVGRGKR